MKYKLLIAGTTMVALGGYVALHATPVSATKYQPNQDTLDSTFVIRSVQPSTSKITISYNGEKDQFRPMYLLNIQAINVDVGATEDQIDEGLPWMRKAMPYWNLVIHYEDEYTPGGMITKYDATETELLHSRYERKIDLDKETMHILYYSYHPGVITGSADPNYLYGKIDYSLCMKSAVYKPGVECRAENKKSGGVWYWPYYNGERLKIPREEWDAWGYSEDEPQPTPTPTPQDTPTDKTQSTNSNQVAVQAKTNTSEVKLAEATQVDSTTSTTSTQGTRETVEVPVSGDTCPGQHFPWWLIILAIIALGCEGVVLYWWFTKRTKD